MSTEFTIVDWRSADARERAADLASATRAANKVDADTPEDDLWLDALGAAIDVAVAAKDIPESYRIDATVTFIDDPTGAWQVSMWFRVNPPSLPPAVAATALLIFTGTALTDGDTVTIGTRTYTFKTVLTGAANEVLIGAVTASLANLKAAVNGTAGIGVTYGHGTVAHTAVVAATLTGTTALTFEATTPGESGNTIAKGETSSNLSWDPGATFSGGADPAPPE